MRSSRDPKPIYVLVVAALVLFLGMPSAYAMLPGKQQAPQHLAVDTKSFHDGIAGTKYAEIFTARGGTAPLRWSATGLPDGLSISEDGAVSGIPVKVGTSTVTVTVTDAAGVHASVARKLKVPTGLPAPCINSSCAVLTPSPKTVQVPAQEIAGITRDAAGALATVTVTGSTVAVGKVLVLAPTADIESGAIVLVNGVKSNSDGTLTATVTPTTPADAYSDGTVKSTESAAATSIGPALSYSTIPSTLSSNKRELSAQLSSAQRTLAATTPISCDSGVTADLHGLSVTPDLTPTLTAIWKHPVAGGGGVYVGTGGLSLFQFDLDGSLALNLGVSMSGQGTCTLTLPEVKRVVPAGDLGAVVLAEQPKLTLTVSGKLDLRTSVTLGCSSEYRWDSGSENRISYCRPSNQPLTVSSDSGVDEVLTGTIDARVTIDDIAGITGQLNASVHAGYHPTDHPVAFLDATAGYQLDGCLACFWPRSPAKVQIAPGTFFDKRIAVWDTPPQPVTTPLQVTSTSLPQAVVAQPYSGPLQATGGSGGYRWVISSGQLPEGLTLEPSTGIIAGVPTAPGVATFTATVTDSAGSTSALTLSLTVQRIKSSFSNVRDIFTGGLGQTAFATKGDGTAWSWGAAGDGLLGTGTSTDSLTPSQIPGLAGVSKVVTDGQSAVALEADGSVWTWGSNTCGVLGNGSTASSAVPVKVSGLSGVQDVAMDNYYSAHALKNDGTVWSWGCNTSGVLGNGTTQDSPVPVQVAGLSGVQKITTDRRTWSDYALKADGTVWSWGGNINGQLGDGTTTSSSVPVQVRGLGGVQDIAASLYSVLALKVDGTVWSWGANGHGVLGNGTTVPSGIPSQIPGLAGIGEVSTNESTAYAMATDGTVWAWGFNNAGQLGIGSSSDSAIPVAVSSLTGIKQLTPGFLSAYALMPDGSAWSWGLNTQGQLGNGTTTSSHVPGLVVGLSDVGSISATRSSGGTAYAIKKDGTAWSWGSNTVGQLGNGTVSSSFVPVQIG